LPLTANSLIEKYADDPLTTRVIMRLYGMATARTAPELAESLQFSKSKTRKALETLVSDGLVVRKGDGRSATYLLSLEPTARNLVTQFLQKTLAGPAGQRETK